MGAIKPAISLSLLIFFLFANSLFAADVAKIGIIDLQRILETSNAGKSIQAELKKQKEKMESDLKRKGTEIETISKRLERESMVMSKGQGIKGFRRLRALNPEKDTGYCLKALLIRQF